MFFHIRTQSIALRDEVILAMVNDAIIKRAEKVLEENESVTDETINLRIQETKIAVAVATHRLHYQLLYTKFLKSELVALESHINKDGSLDNLD